MAAPRGTALRNDFGASQNWPPLPDKRHVASLCLSFAADPTLAPHCAGCKPAASRGLDFLRAAHIALQTRARSSGQAAEVLSSAAL